MILVLLYHDKADTLGMTQDVTRVIRRESRLKTLTRPDRIEASDAFQAFTHGGDADADQFIQVGRCRWREADDGVVVLSHDFRNLAIINADADDARPDNVRASGSGLYEGVDGDGSCRAGPGNRGRADGVRRGYVRGRVPSLHGDARARAVPRGAARCPMP